MDIILNRHAIETDPAREVALDCVEAAIAAVNPTAVTASVINLEDETLRIGETTHDLVCYRNIVVVGGGKVAGGVAQTL